jgi:hypothetical protein
VAVGPDKMSFRKEAMNSNLVYHNNEYTTQLACEFCQGMFEHERWCRTREPRVCYAYQIAADSSRITLGDFLILHSLGVAWPESVHDLIVNMI